MLRRKFYNAATWVWYNLFRRPIYLKAAYDNKLPNPELTVVFLHGISANSDTWLKTCHEFGQEPDLERTRIVALDLLGFGKSLQADWLDYVYLDYNKALDRALKKLKVKGPVILIGHSMGSLIAADYATNYQPSADLKKLILVSPPVLMASEVAKLPDKVYTKTYASLHQIATDVPAAETVARLIQRFSSFRSYYIKTAAFAKSMEEIILNPKNYQTFTHIHIPTIIIHGYFDPLVMGSNLRHAAKANPHYLTYISALGHHDISAAKRAKILLEIKKVLQNERQTQTL